jgi:hypothetical protein
MRKRTLFLIALALQVIAWIVIHKYRASLSVVVALPIYGLVLLSLLAMVRIGLRALGEWLMSDPPQVRRPGICARCGYDMRASPIQCPECGAVVEKFSAPP